MTLLFDGGHNQTHSITGTYGRFAALVREAGYSIETGRISSEGLADTDLLIVVNALASANVNNWTLPILSAFSDAEVRTVRDWVQGGGALLLIADHMPFPGAAEELAAAFGVAFVNGFAFDTTQLDEPSSCLLEDEIQMFRRSDGSLRGHPIVDGRNAGERIDSVATFTGQAFEPAAALDPLLVFGPTAIQLLPVTAWEFPAETPRMPAAGMLQGAVRSFGSGRVALFGEAAMFSVQSCGFGIPMGMNAPRASQNSQFAVNLVRWLVGDL